MRIGEGGEEQWPCWAMTWVDAGIVKQQPGLEQAHGVSHHQGEGERFLGAWITAGMGLAMQHLFEVMSICHITYSHPVTVNDTGLMTVFDVLD